jgi:hypothetical protein
MLSKKLKVVKNLGNCCWKCCRKMLLEIKIVVEMLEMLSKNVVETGKCC